MFSFRQSRKRADRNNFFAVTVLAYGVSVGVTAGCGGGGAPSATPRPQASVQTPVAQTPIATDGRATFFLGSVGGHIG